LVRVYVNINVGDDDDEEEEDKDEDEEDEDNDDEDEILVKFIITSLRKLLHCHWLRASQFRHTSVFFPVMY